MLQQLKQEQYLEIKANLMSDPTLDFVGLNTGVDSKIRFF